MSSPLRPAAYLLAALTCLTAPGALRAQADHALRVEGMPDDAPFALEAFGYDSDLRLRFRLESDWHVYSRDVGGGQPVTLRVDEGDGCDFVAAGELQRPDPTDGKLEGSFDVWLPIRRAGEGRTLAATLELQVCDALTCLAPMRLSIRGRVAPLAVQLVVDEVGARSGRIEAWLKERGFAPTVSVYGETTAAACDAADVVLADSPYFGQYARDALKGVRAFPKTKTPIVGVGFLATELFEAQGYAMTSGYI